MLAIAGLNPLPFRIVPFVILLFNLALLCAVTFTLTKSAEITLLAALFGCFHSRMNDLYFSSANIYDILCYTFYFAALLYYLRRRQAWLPLSVGPALLIICLQILALGAKEMAVTLPAILFVYEAVYHVGRPWKSWQDFKRWWIEVGACLAGAFAVSAVFCIRKLMGPGANLNEAYHPTYSAAFVVESWRKYLGYAIYTNEPGPLVILALVPALALALRSKLLIFSSALILIGSLPVMFVDVRGLNMLYIPMTGWAIFVAALLVWFRERITSLVGRHTTVQVALFLSMAALLCLAHHRDRPDHSFPAHAGVQFIRPFLEELQRKHPTLPDDAHVLLLDDPFPPGQWGPAMILQLYYQCPDLDVVSCKLPSQRAGIGDRNFNVVFTWRDGHLIQSENGPGSLCSLQAGR